jgi:outer membrane protein assembly factor BamA
VTRLNFRGRNHTVNLKANVGGLQQRGLMSYDAPRLFNNPNWRLTFTAFYDNTVDVTTFTSQRLEGSVQAEQIINKASIMTYRLTYRRVRANDISNTVSPDQIPLLSLPTRVAIPNFTYIRNLRDNDLETTKGNYTTVDGGVADSHFGSETDFGRLLIQNSSYYSIGRKRNSDQKFVLARSTRIGIEIPYGNTLMPQPGEDCPAPQICLPLAERFFAGGGNSHRGFGLNQAGPRDPNTGFPLGGTALFVNNIELRMPPPTLPFFQDNISFAIFHDAGNVFTNGHDLFHNLLRWSQKNPELCMNLTTSKQCDYSYISHAIGVGVRYKTPVGPVRFDFGYNLNPPAFPRCNKVLAQGESCPASEFAPQHVGRFNVYFSIGQTF